MPTLLKRQVNGGREQDIWVSSIGEQTCKLVIYDRNISGEYAMQYALTLEMPESELLAKLSEQGSPVCSRLNVLLI